MFAENTLVESSLEKEARTPPTDKRKRVFLTEYRGEPPEDMGRPGRCL